MSAVPEFPPLTREGDPIALVDACVDAAEQLARAAGASTSAAEAKDFAQAVLAFAQALAVMNPQTDVNGVPLEHHENLARISKPEPVQSATNKRVTSRRDAKTGTTTYDVEES